MRALNKRRWTFAPGAMHTLQSVYRERNARAHAFPMESGAAALPVESGAVPMESSAAAVPMESNAAT